MSKSGSRRPLREGEWVCQSSRCAAINSERARDCNECGLGRPSGRQIASKTLGKNGAQKSKGLHSAEDWVCPHCKNINWSRRDTCNLCNSKKHGNEDARTGFGGGYNDRQNVEYVKRDYDDVADELERKRKKKHNKEPEKSAAEKYEEALRAAEEEEEDEDEDDGDLGKYDFDDILDEIKTPGKDNEGYVSSDCSCSCSGGECSCDEEDEPPVKLHRHHEHSQEKQRDRKKEDRERREDGDRSGGRDEKRRDDRSRRNKDDRRHYDRNDRKYRHRSPDHSRRRRSRSRSKDRHNR